MFIKGEGVIITVHNYLLAFDNFYNVSFLNAISYTFPFLVNIYFDEADFYIGNNYCTHKVTLVLTKHNDILIVGSKFYVNESWSNMNDINNAIQVVSINHYKSTGDDNISSIKENYNSLQNNKQLIERKTFPGTGEKYVCFTDPNTGQVLDKIMLSDKNLQISTKTSHKYGLSLNQKSKFNFRKEKESILIYNYLSTVLKTILTTVNPKKQKR